MFVVLNVKSSGKRKIRRGETVDKVHERQTGRGERFYIVDVLDSERGVNWDEVSYFIGKHSKHVLLSRDLLFPDYSLLKRFEPADLKNVLLFNTLGNIFKQMYMYGYRITCYVYDPKGKYASLLPKTVRYASETIAVTNSAFRYFSVSSAVYSDFGASVTVTDKAEITDKAAVIIDTVGDFDYKGTGMLFSVGDNGITPECVDGFDNFKKLCPDYIDMLDFLGAVYTRNREKSLASAVCRTFSRNDESLSVNDIIKELSELKNKHLENSKSAVFYV